MTNLQEFNYQQIANKQKSIGSLFDPDVFDARVADVNANGGVNLVGKRPGVWTFSVASGTKAGVKYDVPVAFTNIDELLAKYVRDRRLWKKDGSGVNYSELAAEVLNKVDMEVDCSCGADLYYGGEYIRTQRNAQYGHGEMRPPKVRNPRQYGALCKHGHSVWEVLPAYTSDFAEYLKQFYGDIIASLEKSSSKEVGAMKKGAEFLKKKETEQEPKPRKGQEIPKEEPEKEEPETEEEENV